MDWLDRAVTEIAEEGGLELGKDSIAVIRKHFAEACKCPICKGKGSTYEWWENDIGEGRTSKFPCKQCNGTGKVLPQ